MEGPKLSAWWRCRNYSGRLKRQRKKQRAGKEGRKAEGCSRTLHADNGTCIQSSDWSEHVPKSTCLQGEKKASVMNSMVMTQFQTLSFIPIGLQGTLLKNLLPFHLSSNMTCFAALLQTHDINSTDQSFQYLENILLSWILAEQTPARFFWLIKSTRLHEDLILKQLMLRAINGQIQPSHYTVFEPCLNAL